MKSIWIILIIGIALRVVLSLTTYHSDMQVFDLAGKLVAGDNILNLYDFSSSSAVFNYPPAIYLFHGFFFSLFNILGLSNIYQFNINLFLLKIPYLFFDLGIAFVIFKLFDSPRKSLIAFTLWMFNPVNLFATYMMGQFDVIPTFFIILSVYMAVKNRLQFAALALGFGVAFKISPVFLIIPLVILGKNYMERIKLIALSIMPYVVSIIPYISSSSFRANALFANQSSKSLYAAIPVSGGESILLFPAILLTFFLYIWQTRRKIEIWKLYLIPLLLFFILTHYHPQWLIWVTPLLILSLMTSGFKTLIPILLIFASWLSSLFFFDPSLTIGIFTFSQYSPDIWKLLHLNPDINVGRSIIQTILAGSAIYLIYEHLFKKENY